MKRDDNYDDFEYFVPTLTETPDRILPDKPQWPVTPAEPELWWKDLLSFFRNDLMRYRWPILSVAGLMIGTYVPAAVGYVTQAKLLRLFIGMAFAAYVVYNEVRNPDVTDLSERMHEFHPHELGRDTQNDIADQVDPYLPQHLKRDRLLLTVVASVIGILVIVACTGMFAPFYVLVTVVAFLVRWLLDRLI